MFDHQIPETRTGPSVQNLKNHTTALLVPALWSAEEWRWLRTSIATQTELLRLRELRYKQYNASS